MGIKLSGINAGPVSACVASGAAGGVAGGDHRTAGRTVAWLAKQMEVSLAPVELSLPQYRVLGYLDLAPAVSSDLAEQLAVRPPSVTAIMDGLVARGLVERQTVVSDRRLVRHVLTDEGRRVLDAADVATGTRLEAIAACTGTKERNRRLLEGLVQWRQALGAFRLRSQSARADAARDQKAPTR